MKKDYSLVISRENSTALEYAKKYEQFLNSKTRRTFKGREWTFLLLILLFIYPYNEKTQSAIPVHVDDCGAHISVLLAGDSLMIAHQLLTGASNYSLKIRKCVDGPWMQPVGDVASGCSRLSYFVLYLKDKPNECQKIVLPPGGYYFIITAYDDLIPDSCTMEGSFYLTPEQVWKTTYSSWDLLNTQYVPILKK